MTDSAPADVTKPVIVAQSAEQIKQLIANNQRLLVLIYASSKLGIEALVSFTAAACHPTSTPAVFVACQLDNADDLREDWQVLGIGVRAICDGKLIGQLNNDYFTADELNCLFAA